MKHIKNLILIALLLCAGTAQASSFTRDNATQIANACIGNWASQTCLKAVSESNMVLASEYGSNLQQTGHPAEAESIKQHCAASTAATQGEYPAYAMKSAFTECANTIYDVTEATKTEADQSRYQVLVGATLCLDADPRCKAVEDGFKGFSQ
jgi:hypothetical protein